MNFLELTEAQSITLLSLFDFKVGENTLTTSLIYYVDTCGHASMPCLSRICVLKFFWSPQIDCVHLSVDKHTD